MTQHAKSPIETIGADRGSPIDRKASDSQIDLKKIFAAIAENQSFMIIGSETSRYSDENIQERLKVVASNCPLASKDSTVGMDVMKEATERNVAIVILPKKLMGMLKEGQFRPDPPAKTPTANTAQNS